MAPGLQLAGRVDWDVLGRWGGSRADEKTGFLGEAPFQHCDDHPQLFAAHSQHRVTREAHQLGGDADLVHRPLHSVATIYTFKGQHGGAESFFHFAALSR